MRSQIQEQKVVLITTTQIDLGLRTIAGIIEKDYSYCYLNLHKIEDLKSELFLLEEILSFLSDSDYILFSLVDYKFENACFLADMIRQSFQIPIVFGGMHAILYPEDCISHCDAVCIGEADYHIKKLLDTWNSRITSIDSNFWFNSKNGIVKTNRSNLIKNLDLLPHPDFKFNNYFMASSSGLEKVSEINSLKYNHHQIGHISTLVYSSDRGCPHNCSYCYNSNLRVLFGNQNYYRKKSVSKIVEELKIIISETLYPYDFINIMNDNMASRTENELADFAKLYKANINLPFYCMVSPLDLNEKKLSFLISAGCKEINIGIQSNEITNRELYNRNQNDIEIHKISKMVNKQSSNLSVYYDFIINNPAESQTSLINTIKLIRSLIQPFDLVSHHLCLGRGTVLYEKLNNLGIIANDDNRIYYSDFHNFDVNIEKYIGNESFFINLIIEWLSGPHNELFQGRLSRYFFDFKNSLKNGNFNREFYKLIDNVKEKETIDFFLNNILFFENNKDLILQLNKILPTIKYSNFNS